MLQSEVFGSDDTPKEKENKSIFDSLDSIDDDNSASDSKAKSKDGFSLLDNIDSLLPSEDNELNPFKEFIKKPKKIQQLNLFKNEVKPSKGLNPFDNLQDISGIVKDRAIKELKSLKDPPIDVPRSETSKPAKPKLEPQRKNNLRRPNKRHPNIFEDIMPLSKLPKSNFDMFKFRSTNPEDLFLGLSDSLNKGKDFKSPEAFTSGFPFVESNEGASDGRPSRRHFDNRRKSSEGAEKLVESLNSDHPLMRKLLKKDQGKLFLSDIKKNIKNLDEMTTRSMQHMF